ncbi:MAG: 1-acyl-sn-glycerol-3-phosphate acyltransferase [Clostridia bacterium]|nr:1-acyl-sn-glycerol-3-phosphate acyltransferase [Clostridia bacterium]
MREMIRTIFWFAGMALSLLLLSPWALYYKLTIKHNPGDPIPSSLEKIVKYWAQCMLAAGGVKVEVKGLENIPAETALFVGNHQGNFDIPIILSKLGPLKSIVAKKETADIPGIKMWMTNFDCIFMDRGNPRQSLQSLNRAQELLEQGRSVIIFPEGTRSKGPAMFEFKPGALRCALKAKTPIVPFAIDGSWRAMEEHNGRMKPATIQLRILPPVFTAEMEKAQTRTISQEVQQLIQDELDTLRNTPLEERISWNTQES